MEIDFLCVNLEAIILGEVNFGDLNFFEVLILGRIDFLDLFLAPKR